MVYQSTLSGALNAQTAEESEYDAFVYVVDSSVSGKVDTKVTGEVVLDGADVSGQVAGNGVDYLDVYNSVIGGKLTVSGAAHGSVVCESEIYGAASFTGNSDTLQLGADGPVVECAGISTYWGDNLDISNNTATIVVSNNIVRGNLSGDGNDPAPTGENNRVRGEITGQFVDLAPAAALRRAAAPEERSGAGEKAAERREAAKAEADAAGKAQL
jgi:hypothetical protein